MRTIRVVGCFVVLIGLLLGIQSASAQTDQDFETGLNPYRSYQFGNIDSINLYNRGLNVDIPIISYPQRGGKLSLNFVLHYADLGNWWDEDCSDGCYYSSSSGVYPQSGFGVIQAGTVASAGGSCVYSGNQEEEEYCSYSLTTADGGSSSFSPINNTTWRSNDTGGYLLSNYTYEDYGGPTPLLVDKNGISYPEGAGNFWTYGAPVPLSSYSGAGFPPAELEDTNGNEIVLSTTSGWEDTMGRSIPLPVSTSTSACPQTPLAPVAAWIWNFPGVSGGTYPVTFCYVSVAYSINLDNSYSNGNLEELQSVLLPNGTSWTFQYTTDGNVDLSQITFPTGGTLSYTWLPTGNYSGGCGGVHSYNNVRFIASRTLNANSSDSSSGTWTYNSGTGDQTVVTDPAGNDTVHTFTAPIMASECPLYETKTQYYQGSHTSGTLQKTVNTSFSAVGYGANGQPSAVDTIWANNKENQTAYTYDAAITYYAATFNINYTELMDPTPGTMSAGLPETKKEYDYGTGTYGNLLRTTTTSYQALNNSSYLNNNLLDLPSSVVVTGSGPGSTTNYSYDENNGSPQGALGNLTSVHRWVNTSSSYLVTSNVYNTNGSLTSSKDPNDNTTTYGYSSTSCPANSGYAGSGPTSVTNAKEQTTYFCYDINSGLLNSTIDPNNQPTSYTYDPLTWRETLVKYPDNGETAYCYSDTPSEGCPSGPPYQVILTKKITSTLNFTETGTMDGLGRLYETELNSDPSNPDYTFITFDTDGRKYSQTNPYRSTSDPTYGVTYYNYDALSRPTLVTDPDGSTVSTAYNGSCTTVTDEAGKNRESCVDGLGRLTEVVENPGGLDYTTNYTYDALDDLTGVSQESSRTRSFIYDSLGRLTSSTNPETGTVNYSYDGDSNVLTKKDARAITITYSWDPLNRMLGKTYSNGDPSVSYTYDQTATGYYNIGSRTSMTDAAGSEAWNYDQMGRVLTDQRTTNSIAKTTSYTYDLNGDTVTTTYAGGRTVTYTYNGAAQATSLADIVDGITYATGAVYAPQGALSALTLGPTSSFTGLDMSNSYNNRLQPSEMKASSTAGTAFDLTYCFKTWASGACQTTGGDNGNVNGITNNLYSNRTQSFTYDPLNRVSTAASSSWSLAFGLDSWGNLLTATATGTATPLDLSVNSNNQVITSPFTYDASGNEIADTTDAYTWNGEGELKTAGGVTYTYDGDGQRIEKSSGTIYWYGKDGEVLNESNLSGTMLEAYVYFNGERIGNHNSSSQYYYYAEDFIGSSRVITTSTGAVCYDADFYPYGGEDIFTNTCSQNYKFTGKERDAETNNDNFGARYFASAYGRFLSPDPANVGADPTNPQSWNMYGYALNSPLSLVDPSGLQSSPPGLCPVPNLPVCHQGYNFYARFESFDSYDPFDNLATFEPEHGFTETGYTPTESFDFGNCYFVTTCESLPLITATGAGNLPPSPQSQASRCTAAQQAAASLARAFDNASRATGWIAFGSAVGTALAGAGEGISFGGDTPITITFGSMTTFFGTASFTTGAIASALHSFASGDMTAVRNFNSSQVANLIAQAASSRIPLVGRWAETIGDLAEQAADLGATATEACQQ